MKLLRVFLVTVLILGAVVFGAYLILESGGQFSPEKCVEKGGKWDEAYELCRQ